MKKRLIRLPGVKKITGYGTTSIYDRLNPESPRYDPTFPRPFKIDGSATNVWVEDEVYAWVDSKIKAARQEVA